MRLAMTLPLLSAVIVAGPTSAQVITPDVVYGHKDGMALTYDVVRPAGPANGAAVAYMVSGGWYSRWTAPATVLERPLWAELSRRGYTLYFVRHGSSPRYDVPEAISDVRMAIAHIRAHAADSGVDRDRIGITGMSAGGHLSLSIGLRAEGPDGDPAARGAQRDNQLAAVVAYYPPVDLRRMRGPNERFPALDFDEALAEDASPVLHATADDPPTLLLHGDEDRLVPLSHSERMQEALSAAGVSNDFVTFAGAGHGFRGEDAARATRLTIEWFDRHLNPGSERD